MIAKVISPLLISLLCLTAAAQQLPDPTLSRCIDDDTLVVIRFDTARLDPKAVVDWMADGLRARKVEPASLNNILRPLRSRADMSAAFLEGLRKAGAKDVYWGLSVQDFTRVSSLPQFWGECGSSGIWVVPLDSKGDESSVMKILSKNPQQAKPAIEARRIGGAIVAAASSRMPQGNAANFPPLWTKAFAMAGDAPLQIIVAPGTVLRKSFEENLPSVPSPAGPIAITTFTQGIQFAVISVSLPPNLQLSAFAQCPDAGSAKALAGALNALTSNLRKQKLSVVSWLPPIEGAEKLFDFAAAGDRVNWAPGQQIINTLQPLIMAQLSNSLQVQSANNMKQILLGTIMYANTRKGQFPPDLATMTKEQALAPSVFIDPLDPFQTQGYIYVPPPAGWRWGGKNEGELAVLYEQYPGGHNVGYADGHVEWFATREEVEKELKKGRP